MEVAASWKFYSRMFKKISRQTLLKFANSAKESEMRLNLSWSTNSAWMKTGLHISSSFSYSINKLLLHLNRRLVLVTYTYILCFGPYGWATYRWPPWGATRGMARAVGRPRPPIHSIRPPPSYPWTTLDRWPKSCPPSLYPAAAANSRCLVHCGDSILEKIQIDQSTT